MSNVGMKARQFLNVITEKCSGGQYSVRRIKASDLFYGSTEEKLLKEAEHLDKNAMAAMKRSRLPKPRIKFNQSRPVDGSMDFWPFYGANGESSKILCVDADRQAVLYDAGAETLETMPRLHEPKESDRPVVLSDTHHGAHDLARPEALYVMDERSGSFETLVYGDPSPYCIRPRANSFVWHWRRLPLPPYVFVDRHSTHGSVACYALLPAADGGNTICVSFFTDSQGTYCFDTASEQWNKAGSWTLPFCGRGHVVPELNGFCFGVTSRYPSHLCAVDLSSVSMDGGGGAPRRPKLWYQWPVMDTPNNDWMLTKISMAYMGAGRFCIAKTFCIHDRDADRFVDDETVLIGVEVIPENGAMSKWKKSKLEMIRHKSVRYGSINHRIQCVL